MSNHLGNKQIFAQNLKRYMDKAGVDRNRLCSDLGFNYTTVCGWLSAEKYPRIDKIEIMANYFGVSKAELVEDPEDFQNYIWLCKTHASNLHIELNDIFDKLNLIGKQKAVENVKKLTQSSKYLETDTADAATPQDIVQICPNDMQLYNRLMKVCKELNSLGLQKMLERVEELTELPRHRIEGIIPNTPEDGK